MQPDSFQSYFKVSWIHSFFLILRTRNFSFSTISVGTTVNYVFTCQIIYEIDKYLYSDNEHFGDEKVFILHNPTTYFALLNSHCLPFIRCCCCSRLVFPLLRWTCDKPFVSYVGQTNFGNCNVHS